jgi:hypothetical protein
MRARDTSYKGQELLLSAGESYFAPAGALECVAPAGGTTWAAAQEGRKCPVFPVSNVFCGVFAAFFHWFGLCDLINLFSVFFMSFLDFELIQI